MNNIEKLIYGRNAIDKYLEIIKIKGAKSNKDAKKLSESLEHIGMDKKTFYLFNTSQNFLEADRCFRFRKNDNPEEIAICDNCVGRCNIQCYNPTEELRRKYFGGCTTPGKDFINSFNNLVPNSLIMKEQINELQKLGLIVDDYYIISPVSLFLTYDTNFTLPDFCVGFAHKINEPQFDIFWGMEKLIEFGHNVFHAMIKAKI